MFHCCKSFRKSFVKPNCNIVLVVSTPPTWSTSMGTNTPRMTAKTWTKRTSGGPIEAEGQTQGELLRHTRMYDSITIDDGSL